MVTILVIALMALALAVWSLVIVTGEGERAKALDQRLTKLEQDLR